MTPTYQLTHPASHPVRPTLPKTMTDALQATRADLLVLIDNTKNYLRSPQSDRREALHLEGFLENLQSQLDDVNKQIEQATA